MSSTNRFDEFLPGHGGDLDEIDRPSTLATLDRDDLEKRFRRRSNNLRHRKTSYLGLVQTGLVAALVVMIIAFRLDVSVDSEMDIRLAEQEIVQMEEIQQTEHIEKPPPPPRPPVPVEVPNDEILADEVELDLDASLDIEAGNDLPPPPPPSDDEAREEEPEIFITVEEMPQMVGGMAALNDELEYPEVARRAGIEGTVVVQVIVDEKGNPTRPSVVKSVHDALDKEAIRAVMQMDFTPGKQRSRSVKVRTNVPVRFRLV